MKIKEIKIENIKENVQPPYLHILEVVDALLRKHASDPSRTKPLEQLRAELVDRAATMRSGY